LLGDRVLSAAILVSIAPSDATGLDWFAGMTKSNVSEYGRHTNPQAVAYDLAMRAERIRANPESMIDFLFPELTGSDKRIVDDAAIRCQLLDTYTEACRNGAYGWIDDVLAFRRPWGFDLSAIKVPTLFWHGADDVFSPVGHTHWLASQVRDAVVKVTVQPGAAHFDAVEVLPSVLAQVQAVASLKRLGVEGPQQAASSA
jgi:pimeloyl-ACP methyl ester carboxylesterase